MSLLRKRSETKNNVGFRKIGHACERIEIIGSVPNHENHHNYFDNFLTHFMTKYPESGDNIIIFVPATVRKYQITLIHAFGEATIIPDHEQPLGHMELMEVFPEYIHRENYVYATN